MTSTTTTRTGEGASPPITPTDSTTAATAPAKVDRPRKPKLKFLMYLAQGGRCHYCNCMMRYYATVKRHTQTPRDLATWEHITPVRRDNKTGKTRPDTPKYLTNPSNLVLACWECNNARGDMPLPDFIALLREQGKRLGIVASIKHLVDDHMPEPWQAQAFDEWMRGILNRPSTPADALNRLPPELAEVLLPDPAPPVAPVSPLVRLLREWSNRLSHVLRLGRT